MRVGHLTDTGRQRDLNEDSLYINERMGLYILADGMGGHNAGEVAGWMAVTLTAALVEEGLDLAAAPVELVRSAIAKTNEIILQKSLCRTAWSEMGSTLVMALFIGSEVVIAHVGDSRAYRIDGGDMQQLTEDHTFVAEWLKEGLITKEEARIHAQRHGLTEALGVTDEVEVDVKVRHWDENGCLLLCSDGLTDMIDDEDILAIVQSSNDPDEACRRLVDAANGAGGSDNITVVLICSQEKFGSCRDENPETSTAGITVSDPAGPDATS